MSFFFLLIYLTFKGRTNGEYDAATVRVMGLQHLTGLFYLLFSLEQIFFSAFGSAFSTLAHN